MSIPSYPTKLIKRTPPADESIKRDVITHYGHVCVCEGCGETRLSELTLDHLNGGGNAQRRALKRQGSSYYREVKRLIDAGHPPTDLQVLCRPCNLSKGNGEQCRMHGVLSAQGAAVQGLDDTVLSEDDIDVIDQEPESASSTFVQFSGRCKKTTKKWLLGQTKAIGAIVDDLVEEKRSGETTVLAEVRAFRREVLDLLSDLALKQCDPDSRIEESHVEHDFRHAIMSPQPPPQRLPSPPVTPTVVPLSRWRRAWWRLWR